MADINNIESLQDLKDVIDVYLRSPRQPPLKGSELNIILSKILALLPVLHTDVVVTTDIVINWQTDIVPGEDRTFAQKHGNKIVDVIGLMDISGNITKYSPGLSYVKTGGYISTVNITEIFPGTITII